MVTTKVMIDTLHHFRSPVRPLLGAAGHAQCGEPQAEADDAGHRAGDDRRQHLVDGPLAADSADDKTDNYVEDAVATMPAWAMRIFSSGATCPNEALVIATRAAR